MWKSREKHPIPERDGIYVVARFVDGVMKEWSNNYAYVKELGGWQPNKMGDEYIIFTHWMTYGEYRNILELTEREE